MCLCLVRMGGFWFVFAALFGVCCFFSSVAFCVWWLLAERANDTLAEWLRRRPAKPMGSPRVGSNPTGVGLYVRVLRAVLGRCCVRRLVLMIVC